MMRVTGLHRLPFDLARDLAAVAGSPDEAAFEAQYRENWENAWIVVVESDAEPDFGAFSWPDQGQNAQAAWLERVLAATPGRVRSAFFLHHIDSRKPLLYEGRPCPFPPATPAPAERVEVMEYCSPD